MRDGPTSIGPKIAVGSTITASRPASTTFRTSASPAAFDRS